MLLLMQMSAVYDHVGATTGRVDVLGEVVVLNREGLLLVVVLGLGLLSVVQR